VRGRCVVIVASALLPLILPLTLAFAGPMTAHSPVLKPNDLFVKRIAGGGSRLLPSIDRGAPAIKTRIGTPMSIAVDRHGDVFFGEDFSFARPYPYCDVQEVRNGRLWTVAGRGLRSDGSGSTPALRAPIDACTALAFAHGDLYVAGFSVVYRVDMNSRTIVRIAGRSPLVRGGSCHVGIGGPRARSACFDGINGLAVDKQGDVFIADTGDSLIREVTPNGRIHRVAGLWPGHPRGGHSGDGGPAAKAAINHPGGMAIGANGNLYFADTWGNGRVQEINFRTGIISTVAGGGYCPDHWLNYHYCGEDGLAVRAHWGFAGGVAVAPNGDLFINGSGCILRVSHRNNHIYTVAGGAVYRSSDAQLREQMRRIPARSAVINGSDAGGIAVGSNGLPVFGDPTYQTIRQVLR
jgi:hypothetical protein